MSTKETAETLEILKLTETLGHAKKALSNVLNTYAPSDNGGEIPSHVFEEVRRVLARWNS